MGVLLLTITWMQCFCKLPGCNVAVIGQCRHGSVLTSYPPCSLMCRLRILKSFQLALDRFNMTDGKLPHATPSNLTDQDRHWLKLMAKMLRTAQRESAAAGAAAAAKGGKAPKDASATAFSATLMVTEQDVLDALFTVKVREGMDAVMVSTAFSDCPSLELSVTPKFQKLLREVSS